jgi:hypothetical protein
MYPTTTTTGPWFSGLKACRGGRVPDMMQKKCAGGEDANEAKNKIMTFTNSMHGGEGVV